MRQVEDVLFSLHMKATMMKVSDPIIFGACVEVFFQSLITEHREALNAAGVNFSNGLGDLIAKMDQLPDATREQVEVALKQVFEDGPIWPW